MMILNQLSLTKSKEWLKGNFDYEADNKDKSLPFVNYVLEDKSHYPLASSSYNENINANYIDKDNDFLIGNSGGFLLNLNFVFAGIEKDAGPSNSCQSDAGSNKSIFPL